MRKGTKPSHSGGEPTSIPPTVALILGSWITILYLIVILSGKSVPMWLSFCYLMSIIGLVIGVFIDRLFPD